MDEITQARGDFEKPVALTISALAIAQALLSTVGSSASDDALMSTTKAANRWAHYQSKSTKESLYRLHEEQLSFQAPSERLEEARLNAHKQTERYEAEKEQIKIEAEKLESQVLVADRIGDVCDAGNVVLQVAIVVASVSILIKWRYLWYASLILGVVGLGFLGFAVTQK